MDEEKIDRVLQALSHRSRRKMLDIVREQPGCSVSEIFEKSRIPKYKTLKVCCDATTACKSEWMSIGAFGELAAGPVPGFP